MFLPSGASLHAGAPTRATKTSVEQVIGADSDGVVTSFDISGPVAGVFVLLLDAASATALAQRLLGNKESIPYSSAALGALAEMGNIAASTFLNVIADRVQQVCLPSVPNIQQGRASAILEEITASHAPLLGEPETPGLLYAMDIHDAGDIQMWMWFVPQAGAIERLEASEAAAGQPAPTGQ